MSVRISGKLTLYTTTELTKRQVGILTFLVLVICMSMFCGCKRRPSARPTVQMDAEPRFWIRVLLYDNIKTLSLRMSYPFSIINPEAQIPDMKFEQTDKPINVEISSGTINFAGWNLTTKEIIIAPETPNIFNINGDDYRGKLLLITSPDGNSLDAVNLVPLEAYLKGVVGTEMPNYWEPAALEAQAIAARTYCLYIKERFGKNRHWDVSRTQANQAYNGVKAESAQVSKAVNKTSGMVLVCNHNGENGIFPAYYSSTCGGHTENSKNMFGGDSFAPLAGVECPYCKDVAKAGFFFWNDVKYDKSEVQTRLLNKYSGLTKLGKIDKIIPVRQSDYNDFSRLTLIRLKGSTGKTDVLRAEDLRLAIDSTGLKLKSTIFKIIDAGDKWVFDSGRGFGHGVGMCQCGAQGMAKQGKKAGQILFYYYPGSKIESVYE